MKGKLAAAPVPGLMKPGVNVGTQTPRWELESVRQAEGAESLPIAMTPDDAQIYEADLSAVGLLVPPNDFSSSKVRDSMLSTASTQPQAETAITHRGRLSMWRRQLGDERA